MNFILKILIFIGLTLPSFKVQANTYSAALKQYRRGQFKKSIQLSNKAIKKSRSKAQRAKLYKLNGMSYYMLGSYKYSKKSFQIALKYNPRTTVKKSEVLNPKVVSFFNSVKKSSKKKPQETSCSKKV